MSTKLKRKRPKILERERLLVWAAAAGRCTFCNASLLGNDDLGEPVPIGELAHNVGWKKESPRGKDVLPDSKRNLAENLILTCPSCHKPIDDGGAIGRYSVTELRRRKIEHETRIRLLCEIGPNQAAHVLRMVGMVRATAPELSRETVLQAATTSGIYPKILPTSHWQDIEIDLRVLGDPSTFADFQQSIQIIRQIVQRINDGVRRNEIKRVAVFAIARIPLLVELGARLDDKLPLEIFQRHHTDNSNPWIWPSIGGPKVTFQVRLARGKKSGKKVALMINQSGTIKLSELPVTLKNYSIYTLSPKSPNKPNPSLIQTKEALVNFESTLRTFLAGVENTHGKVNTICLFPAVGVAPAITLGRVLMSGVSPYWTIFDRDDQRKFFRAGEVKP